jgi:UPF0716 protein FxsA
MRAVFLLILILLPAVEITLFIQLGGAIGAGWTFLLIIATAAIGLSAMRQQGMATLAQAQMAQAEGRQPVAEMGNGLLILMAGLLLLIPGFLTDALGLMLLWPFGRRLMIGTMLAFVLPAILASLSRRAQAAQAGQQSGQQSGPQSAAQAEAQAETQARPHMDARASRGGPKTIEGDFTVNDD